MNEPPAGASDSALALLARELLAGPEAPVTVIHASAGAADRLRGVVAGLPPRESFRWLRLTVEHDAPADFAASLGGRSGEAETATAELVESVIASGRVFTLVLEGLELIRHPDTRRAIRLLVEHAPPELRIVALSPGAFPLRIPRLRARRRLKEILLEDPGRISTSP